MLGESEDNWRLCVQRAIELDPDSVTIYQMELPFNTAISGDLLKGTGRFANPVAGWATTMGQRRSRRWRRRATRWERLHSGEGSVPHPLRLP